MKVTTEEIEKAKQTVYDKGKNELIVNSCMDLGLTRRESEFVFWISNGQKKQKSAKLAGYSPRSAAHSATKILKKPLAQKALAMLAGKRNALEVIGKHRNIVKARDVLGELSSIATADARKMFNPDGSLKLPQDWDDDLAACIGAVEVTRRKYTRQDGTEEEITVTKIKRWPKVSALDILAKHHNLLTSASENIAENALLALRDVLSKRKLGDGDIDAQAIDAEYEVKEQPVLPEAGEGKEEEESRAPEDERF